MKQCLNCGKSDTITEDGITHCKDCLFSYNVAKKKNVTTCWNCDSDNMRIHEAGRTVAYYTCHNCGESSK